MLPVLLFAVMATNDWSVGIIEGKSGVIGHSAPGAISHLDSPGQITIRFSYIEESSRSWRVNLIVAGSARANGNGRRSSSCGA